MALESEALRQLGAIRIICSADLRPLLTSEKISAMTPASDFDDEQMNFELGGAPVFSDMSFNHVGIERLYTPF